MAWLTVIYYGKCNHYVLINCIRYCIRGELIQNYFNSLSTNLQKWSNTQKQFIGNLPTNCLSVFDHSGKLALKRLTFSTFNHLG